ncbi:histidine phosphatase family protein [Rhizobium skierniewicense]|uniref:histidine phosphatase family protein n=1 Tax=Rhizobium skierniewicense TaxID=984260 RepID=UPI0015733870|nr:histidine phosphatase family protein [Rhizobium skierniewicense]NTF30727.1 histidine phosphatase family protein [Rhizobium skierniewicense]
MYALYITHPQVRIDADVPVPEWGLSELGVERTRKASALPWAKTLRRIVSSAENKATETAQIVASVSGVAVETVPDMHENDRSATGFLPPDQFEAAANWFFAHPHASYKGWETAIDAQARIVSAVETVLADHDPMLPIAFVGHGGVGTLLKCHLAGSQITRSTDQPPGGGNLFCFTLADRRITCDWTAMETWRGETWQRMRL